MSSASLFPEFLDSPLIFARVILIDNREARSRVIHAERSVTWEYRRPSNFDSVLYFVSRYVIHRVLSKQSIVPVSLRRCDRSTQLRDSVGPSASDSLVSVDNYIHCLRIACFSFVIFHCPKLSVSNLLISSISS